MGKGKLSLTLSPLICKYKWELDVTWGTAIGQKCMWFTEAKVNGGGGDVVAGKTREPEPSCRVTMGNYTDSQGISEVPAQLSLGSAKEPDAGAEWIF